MQNTDTALPILSATEKSPRVMLLPAADCCQAKRDGKAGMGLEDACTSITINSPSEGGQAEETQDEAPEETQDEMPDEAPADTPDEAPEDTPDEVPQ